jgi:type IV pilus assembly protein PilP
MGTSVRVLGLVLLLSLLSGCDRSGPYGDLKRYMAQVRESQTGTKDKKLDLKLPTPVAYNGNLRRSPFSESVVTTGPAKSAVTNPLQAYSLTMLRLLGTVSEKGETVAYITAPDNMVYRVQVGDIIGDRHGKIINIQPGSVNVMELDADNPNEQMQRVVSLKLRSESP